ncbi:hypothetical protein Tco_1208067, partial [Tanacetum coccineum]
MFRSSLKLRVETLENPFIAPANLEFIQPFMKIIGYQGDVDKVSAFFMKNLAQPWQTMIKRFKEGYHSIKDDIPLVSVYTIGNVIVRGMLIMDEFLIDDICATLEYKEYEKVFVWLDVPTIQPQPVESTQGTIRTPSAHRTPTPTAVVSDVGHKKKRNQVVGETSS